MAAHDTEKALEFAIALRVGPEYVVADAGALVGCAMTAVCTPAASVVA